jgi:hypothetical protein
MTVLPCVKSFVLRPTHCHAPILGLLGAASTPAPSTPQLPNVTASPWTRDDILKYANNQGVDLSLSTLGPGYRAVARSTQNASDILGYAQGFTRGSILHLDSMQAFKPVVTRVRSTNPNFRGGGTIFGVGLLLGYLCLSHGLSHNCKTAEFLAIDDDDRQHERLVRYYTAAGFRIVKCVGDDDWQCIPDRIVWGGCGTLLRSDDIHETLQYWTTLLIKSQAKEEQRNKK